MVSNEFVSTALSVLTRTVHGGAVTDITATTPTRTIITDTMGTDMDTTTNTVLTATAGTQSPQLALVLMPMSRHPLSEPTKRREDNI
jgi:hypothetical protein